MLKEAKKPISVLVLVHTQDLQILLLERAGHPGFWQSVTGSQEADEAPTATAARELYEETGIDAAAFELKAWNLHNRFEIFEEWRHRYAPEVTHNLEQVFSLELPAPLNVTLAPYEHRAAHWLPWQDAADAVFSWTNRDAIVMLALERLRESQS
jgi:dihydroneopterin triphosphate diphosphatase